MCDLKYLKILLVTSWDILNSFFLDELASRDRIRLSKHCQIEKNLENAKNIKFSLMEPNTFRLPPLHIFN